MKKTLKKSSSLLLLIASLALISCHGQTTSQITSEESSNSQSSLSSQSEIISTEETSIDPNWKDEPFKTFKESVYVDPATITLADNEFHTEKQLAYINGTWNQINKFAYGRSEQALPRGVKIIQNDPNDQYVQLSLNADFSSSYVYELDLEKGPYVKNLLAGKKYYYRTSSDAENFVGEAKTITISDVLPRNLDISGVLNVRDLGGYTSKLGGHIKQNMFIRGGRLNAGSDTPVRLITDKGYKTLTQQIGVKTEIDLRSGAEETNNMNNDLFPEIEYHLCPMNTRGVDNILETFKDSVRDVFKLYADKDNYPIYVHCKIGTDRTGAVSYLMGALLGMKNEDLIRDYLFSNFANIRSVRDYYVLEDEYWPLLRSYQKENLQLCAEAFLLDCGVTQQEINQIKTIMIEK